MWQNPETVLQLRLLSVQITRLMAYRTHDSRSVFDPKLLSPFPKISESFLGSYCLRVSIAMKRCHDKGNSYKGKTLTRGFLVHCHHGWGHGRNMVVLTTLSYYIPIHRQKESLGLV